MGRKGSAGEVVYIEQNCTPIDTTYYVKPVDAKHTNLKFLFHILKMLELPLLRDGAGVPGLNRTDVYTKKKIPLPPLEVQEKIVSEIEGYQKIIDAARQIVENYKPTIKINPIWPMVELGKVSTSLSGGTPSTQTASFWNGDIPWVSPKDMKSTFIDDAIDHLSNDAIKSSKAKMVEAGTLLCVVRSGILAHTFPVAVVNRPVCFNQDINAIKTDESKLLTKYLLYLLLSRQNSILADGIKKGVTVHSFRNGYLKEYKIPLPPIAEQNQIVEEIEAEQRIVNENKKLAEIFENKIKSTISEIWSKESDEG